MQSLNNINHMSQPRSLRRVKRSLPQIPAAQELAPSRSHSIRLPYTFASPENSSLAGQTAVIPASTQQVSQTSPTLASPQLPPLGPPSTPAEQNPTREHKGPTLTGHRHATLIDGWIRSPEMTASRLGINILSKSPRYKMLRSIRSHGKMLTKLCKSKKPAVAFSALKKPLVISTPSNPLHVNNSSGASTAMTKHPARSVEDSPGVHGITLVLTPPSDTLPHPKPLRSNPVSEPRHANYSISHAARTQGHLTVDHCWEVLYKREHCQSRKRMSDLTANLTHEKEASLYWEEAFVKLHRECTSRDVLIRTQSSKNQIRTLESEKKHLEKENIALNTQLVQALALAEHWKMLFQQQERLAEALQRRYGNGKTPVALEDPVEEGESSHDKVEPLTLKIPQPEPEHEQPVPVEPSRADAMSPTSRETDDHAPELSAIALACEPKELSAGPAKEPVELDVREDENTEPAEAAGQEVLHELAEQDRQSAISWPRRTDSQQARPDGTDLGNIESPSQSSDWSLDSGSDSHDEVQGGAEEEVTACLPPLSQSLPNLSFSPAHSLAPPRHTEAIFHFEPRRIELVPAVHRISIESGRDVQADAWASTAMNTWEWCSVPSLALELRG
ncbi:hypothetical protein JHW43_006359 [Diplocarpon mali]|nr:hypothetical protein JHW43_006359 [Diplocarpon mali]